MCDEGALCKGTCICKNKEGTKRCLIKTVKSLYQGWLFHHEIWDAIHMLQHKQALTKFQKKFLGLPLLPISDAYLFFHFICSWGLVVPHRAHGQLGCMWWTELLKGADDKMQKKTVHAATCGLYPSDMLHFISWWNRHHNKGCLFLG